ncbi:MAG: transcriptional repressor NrdR [Gemmatimonadetes bacterium]|nr:transcriptional repressor NrdR [Gemmatimonadota bacterium]MYB05119.1 transcriptional repressor NrdR [Gemmatimonadota bacterium]MYE15083.1 transcriptional repressor NrdR [Gemmatimonadota bacterium]MYG23606.1 transcriptional repressor NrdR [Gemmatimonadota bacterium]MYJ39263.1 transcriptional repressor NrdR [Gemmatimonadota bacterium]
MRCPSCEGEATKVVDTRAARGGRAVRRRRECLRCGGRFTTYENVEQRPLQVLKRDGSAEDFQRDKLRASIATACTKRPVSPSEVEALVDRIEDGVSGSAGVEISSAVIGEAVMEGLEPLDRVAYIRYASVYRNFQHIDEFQEAVDELIVKERRVEQGRLQVEMPLEADTASQGDSQ